MDPIIQGGTFDERLASVARTLAAKRNIVVLAGAGISVSCGIPDFRSPAGLYNTLDCGALGLACPEDLFDIEAFRDDPRPFYRFARSLYPGSIAPGPSHAFLAWLDGRGALRRVYTQNIDALERSAGVPGKKVVYAHGSLSGAKCMKCRAKYSASDVAAEVQAGTVPLCRIPRNKRAKLFSIGHATKKPRTTPTVRRANPRRSAAATSGVPPDDGVFEPSAERGLCGGVIKPNVTFFGEKLGDDVGRSLQKDRGKADALIVMGTSLSVAPMTKVVEYFPPHIPRVLINRNMVRVPKASDGEAGPAFHACLIGNCDDVVGALREKMTGANTNPARGHEGAQGLVTTDEEWLRGQPKESVLLFPGAEVAGAEGPEEPGPPQKLVVHCDGCREEIRGTVFRCKSCFDYDLCGSCHPRVSLMHAGGRHEFAEEG